MNDNPTVKTREYIANDTATRLSTRTSNKFRHIHTIYMYIAVNIKVKKNRRPPFAWGSPSAKSYNELLKFLDFAGGPMPKLRVGTNAISTTDRRSLTSDFIDLVFFFFSFLQGIDSSHQLRALGVKTHVCTRLCLVHTHRDDDRFEGQ